MKTHHARNPALLMVAGEAAPSCFFGLVGDLQEWWYSQVAPIPKEKLYQVARLKRVHPIEPEKQRKSLNTDRENKSEPLLQLKDKDIIEYVQRKYKTDITAQQKWCKLTFNERHSESDQTGEILSPTPTIVPEYIGALSKLSKTIFLVNSLVYPSQQLSVFLGCFFVR